MIILIIIVITTSFVVVTDGTVTCKSIGVCGCELTNGGGTVDLSPLTKLGSAPLYTGIKDVSGTGQTYDFDPCREFPCGTLGQTRVCSTNPDGQTKLPLGKDITYHYEETSKVITFIYSQESGTVNAKTHVAMHCLSGEEGLGILNEIEQRPLHTPNFYTSLDSKYACLVKSHSNKLSTGSVLCILLLVFIILYIGGGILINKYVRKLETDLFPNITFWKDFPSLVKTGVAFTIEKLPVNKKDEYEKI